MRFLILSRNPGYYSTSRLVRAGRALGHEVDVIDPLCLEIVVVRGSPSLTYGGDRLARYDAVIPRIGASAGRFGLSVLREFEDAGVPVLNESAAVAVARDKVRSLQVLARCRIAVPRTVCIKSVDGVDAALSMVGGYPVVLKLQSGTQGVGTMIAESRRAAGPMIDTLWAMGQEILVQEYVAEAAGRDVRVFVVGGMLVASMRRTAPRGEFRANLHRGARADQVQLGRRYERCATRAAEALGLEVCGVDMFETASGPIVIEVNSSPGLEGIEQATGADIGRVIVERAEKMAAGARRGSRRAAWS